MILTGIAVFLFGTAVSAGPFIPHIKAPAEIVVSKHSSTDKFTEYYPSSSGSPFISNFIQKGTNVFFKPQFTLSAAQMPPQIQTMIAAIDRDDCKTSLPMGPIPMLLEEPKLPLELPKLPLFVEEPEEIVKVNVNPQEIPEVAVVPSFIPESYVRKVVISPPEAPALPPYVPIEIPKPVMIEDNLIVVKEEVFEGPKTPIIPCEETETVAVVMPIPDAPVLSPYIPVDMSNPIKIEEPIAVVVETETLDNVAIPAAPVLPPFEMPELPVVIEESTHISPPFISEVIVSPPNPIVIEEKPAAIPEAPLLLPLSLPELPVKVEVEETVVPCGTVEVIEHLVIPEAPVLTPYEPIKTPTSVFAQEHVIVDIQKPVKIPSAPVLPPFEMPVLPVVIEESTHISQPFVPEVIVSPPNPTVFEEKPMVVPEAPVLPPLSLPELPVKVEIEEKVMPCDTLEVVEHFVIPEAPLLTPYLPIKTPTSVFAEEYVTVEIQKPVAIPSALVLPPLEMPKAPVMVEEMVAPCSPENQFEQPKVVIESGPIAMSVPYAFRELSSFNTHISKPVIMPSAPEFLVPYFPVVTEKLMEKEPTSCVRDIVVERILPKLEKSLEPKAAKVPVSAYLAPFRYALF